MGERGRADARATPVPVPVPVPVTIVMATRDRRAEALIALGHLLALPERPAILVVDNGSGDGTVEAIRRARPEVATIALGENLGGTARTVGAAAATTRYVAFSDDDSWWTPGSIGRAAELLDAHPRLGVVVARVLVGEERRLDPISAEMRSSPLPHGDGAAGVPVLGFLACSAAMRRNAYLDVGGFHRHFGIGGEEALVAMDIAAAGWEIGYVDELVVHHHPSRSRDPLARRRILARNDLWTSWLRRPGREVRRRTLRAFRTSVRDPAVRAGLLEAARGLPWVLAERRPLTDKVEAELRLVDDGQVEAPGPGDAPHTGRPVNA